MQEILGVSSEEDVIKSDVDAWIHKIGGIAEHSIRRRVVENLLHKPAGESFEITQFSLQTLAETLADASTVFGVRLGAESNTPEVYRK